MNCWPRRGCSFPPCIVVFYLQSSQATSNLHHQDVPARLNRLLCVRSLHPNSAQRAQWHRQGHEGVPHPRRALCHGQHGYEAHAGQGPGDEGEVPGGQLVLRDRVLHKHLATYIQIHGCQCHLGVRKLQGRSCLIPLRFWQQCTYKPSNVNMLNTAYTVTWLTVMRPEGYGLDQYV